MKQLLACLCLAFVALSACATPKEEYELQERCGNSAAKWFKGEWGQGGLQTDKDGSSHIVSYRNHYNIAMNRCFVLLRYQSVPKKGESSSLTQQTLFDLNESKDYGAFYLQTPSMHIMDCNVRSKRCANEDEWNTLIAPLMGD